MEPLVLGLSLVDLVVVGGVAVVLPVALGGAWRWWALSALAVAVSFSLDRGALAAALVLGGISLGVLERRSAA